MVMCCAINCKNKSATHKRTPGSSPARMFSFPKDKTRRKVWANTIKRANWTPTDHSRLCDAHFEERMFRRRPVEGRWLLKHDAIPTLFGHIKRKNIRKPPLNRNSAEEAFERNKSTFALDHSYNKPFSMTTTTTLNHDKEEVEEESVFIDQPCDKLSTFHDLALEEVSEEVVIQNDSLNTSVLCSNCQNVGTINKALVAKNHDLHKQILRLKASYKVARLSLQQRCNFISKKAKCLSTNEDKVKKFLNDDQIKFLCRNGKKTTRPWTISTIKKALKLRFTCGLSGYSTLIDQGYPLPSIRTLQRAFADNVLAIDVLDENDKMSETTSKKVEEL
uniref:THAP-type domain-containing protein n=1 Tax=Lepeophtheirus salmonis TaxID=72036 RepID=A0A0K2UYE5_LEPSM